MANPVMYNADGIIKGLVASSVVVDKGDLVGYASGFVRADCNVAAGYFAQGIALQHGRNGSTIKIAKSCTIIDDDAPFTANTPQYLSGTAGGWTETMPATGGDIIQVIGRSAGTDRFLLHCPPPRLENLFFTVNAYDTTSEPGLGKADTGWAGPEFQAAELMNVVGRLPSNMVALLEARLLFNSIGLTAADVDYSIVGAYDGSANNEDTGTAQTTADMTYTADNKIAYLDCDGASTLFDAGFALPGRNFTVLVDADGVTGGTAQLLGLSVKVLVV